MIPEIIRKHYLVIIQRQIKINSILAIVFKLLIYVIIALVLYLLINSNFANLKTHFPRIIIFLFLFEFCFRFFFQKIYLPNFRSFQTLQIRKNTSIKYFALLSIISTNNFRAWILFISLLLSKSENLSTSIFSVISALLITIIIHFNFISIKVGVKESIQRIVFISLIIIISIILYILPEKVSKILNAFSINQKLTIYPLIGLAGISVYIFYKVLANFKIISTKKRKSIIDQLIKRINYSQYNITILVFAELMVFIRTNRSKNIIYGGLLFQVAAYLNISILNLSPFLNFYFLLVAVSLMPYSYGQYLFGWNSDYISLLLTKNIDINKFLKGKILILVLLTLISPCILIVFDIFNSHTHFVRIISISIFCSGFLSLILIYFNIKGKSRVELNSKGYYANWQGKSINQFYTEIIFYGVPLVIYSLSIFVFNSKNDLIVYFTLGLIGIVSFLVFIIFPKIFTNRYIRMRHHIYKYLHYAKIND